MSADALADPAPPTPEAPPAGAVVRLPDAARHARWLFRAALVAGPLAAVLLSTAPTWSPSRVPTGWLGDPVTLFVVLFNLFFSLPYLSAFAFALVRPEAQRAHAHAVLFAMLTFGAMALWAMVLLTASR